MTLTLSSAPSSNPTAWERGVTPGHTESPGGGAVMWGKQLAHSTHSGARPPHQLSRQVSQEDKGPPPPAAAPPPTRATRCGGGGRAALGLDCFRALGPSWGT